MSVISYNGLVALVNAGVIDAPLENLNGASIDITLGNELMIERRLGMCQPRPPQHVDLAKKQTLDFAEVTMTFLYPNQFALAHTVETFNLPHNIAAEYKLKSSLARCGLDHLNAGWCDPGWHGQLTLELKNVSEFGTLALTPGMKIGQMVFHQVLPVPDEKSYKERGQYNGQQGATQSKGVR